MFFRKNKKEELEKSEIKPKEEEKKEINQIRNSQLKFNICNTAIGLLVETGELTNDDLPSLEYEFGYLFTKIDGDLEGLMKINTDNKVCYCALQKGSLMLVNINEELYQETINNMKKFHPCLNEMTSIETDKMIERKNKNCEYMSKLGLTINPNLVGYNDADVELKDIDTICKRAIASLLVIQVACDINNGTSEESVKIIKPVLEKFGVLDCLNSKERRILDGTYNEQDPIDMDWAYEAYWSLCWCLGLVDDIKDGGKLCDCSMAIQFVATSKSLDEFKGKCKLRSKEEILDMLDLYYRYHWTITNKYVDSNTNIGNLNPSNVVERRRGLEWVISDLDDWYDITMNA